jgi:hypothetical protein
MITGRSHGITGGSPVRPADEVPTVEIRFANQFTFRAPGMVHWMDD